MKIGLTLTGVDERTPKIDIVHLGRCDAEIGILYTFSPDGRNRYPSPGWIKQTARVLTGKAAIHICGERARQQLYDGSLGDLLEHVRRIQVNGHLSPQWLAQICAKYPTKTIITQHNPKNLWLLPVDAPNHAVLVDSSGGRGISPASWDIPDTDKPIGFAGGLGPENIIDCLGTFDDLCGNHAKGIWVDMEGKLRDKDDWFSIGIAYDVIDKWLNSKQWETAPQI